MNKRRTAQPASTPFASDTTVRPLRREAPLLWNSSLISQPVWSGRESELPHLSGDRVRLPPVATTNLLLGSWDPRHHPVFQIRREDPIRRESVPGRGATATQAATPTPPPAAVPKPASAAHLPRPAGGP